MQRVQISFWFCVIIYLDLSFLEMNLPRYETNWQSQQEHQVFASIYILCTWVDLSVYIDYFN